MAIITTQWPPSSPSRRPSVLDVDLLFTLGHHTRAHARMQNPLLAPPPESSSRRRRRWRVNDTSRELLESIRAKERARHAKNRARIITIERSRSISREKPVVALYQKRASRRNGRG